MSVRNARDILVVYITPADRTVLRLLASGETAGAIAARLNTSEHELESGMRGLFATLGARSRSEAVDAAVRRGLLSPRKAGQTMRQRHTLVLGGTGKTGRRIAGLLWQRGVSVRVGSRSALPLFDWDARETWAAALRDVESVYVSYYPDLAAEGAADAIAALTALAVSSGVNRLVLLSGRGEQEAQRCEEIVRQSGARWTIVRASWFAQNFSESYLLEPILDGEVALPAGDVGEPFIDVDDIADVVVEALTDERHVGQIYEVTGPRLWTFADAVAEIGRVTGRRIRYTRIPADRYASMLRDAKLPEPLVTLITYLFTEVLDGRNASVTDGVQRALGRPPRDFADYVRTAAATGVWDAAANERGAGLVAPHGIATKE